jgi:hypothetical protein
MIPLGLKRYFCKSTRALNDKKYADIHSLNIIFGIWYEYDPDYYRGTITVDGASNYEFDCNTNDGHYLGSL